MQFVLATENPHKLEEFSALFGKRASICSLSQAGVQKELPEETGLTFAENAKIKAEFVFNLTQKVTLADDSGLVVPALEGDPGVYSARYAGPSATDADNRSLLIKNLQKKKLSKTPAYFVCVLACVVRPDLCYLFEGRCYGEVQTIEKGNQGFGYDPLFIPQNYTQTFAELAQQEKGRLSHRFHALQKLERFFF